jgi:hypothetical protein
MGALLEPVSKLLSETGPLGIAIAPALSVVALLARLDLMTTVGNATNVSSSRDAR